MLKISFSYKPLLNSLLSSSLLALVATSCACTDAGKPEAKNRDQQGVDKEVALADNIKTVKAPIRKAAAKLKPYKDHEISGTVTFTKVSEGIKVIADVDGLKPGKHGFHVHEYGNCSGEDGKAAGEHFNPTHTKHGGPDSPERHVGDLGNLEADENGHAHYERVNTIIALEGENSIIDRSIMIHADPDDFTTQPSGNSGDKIACGKIEVVED